MALTLIISKTLINLVVLAPWQEGSGLRPPPGHWGETASE